MKLISKEDQASPASYEKMLISVIILFSSQKDFPLSHSQSVPIASTVFTLYWCSGAHHFKVGGTVTTMPIHLLRCPYGISSHSHSVANWPYPSQFANMATSSSYGPFMAICLLGPSWPFNSIQKP
ncbi:hypothetical protein O181_073195 [Austropuccinia psidii MF-1]|uniref:Uncharacterized protein n=1 Tax=Austropuccinia psidii MF-1 TaxID=1389203 RepID=A0A9Q3FA30_9BASI|nr:hypothetical protein [Austropuccinia psidii MF-1]